MRRQVKAAGPEKGEAILLAAIDKAVTDELQDTFRAGISLRLAEVLPQPEAFDYVAPAAHAITYKGAPLWRSVDTLGGFTFGLMHLYSHYYTLYCRDDLGDYYTYGRETFAGWREWLVNPQPL